MVCLRHVPWMDLKVWRNCSDYKWQRSPVHYIPMVRHLLPTQDQVQDHHSLPPSVQRHGGKVPQAVKEFLTSSSDWFEHLPWVLLGLRTSPREDSATSASEAVYGSVLTLPGQFLEVQDPPTNVFYENLKNSMSGFQPTTIVLTKNIESSTLVWHYISWPVSSWC